MGGMRLVCLHFIEAGGDGGGEGDPVVGDVGGEEGDGDGGIDGFLDEFKMFVVDVAELVLLFEDGPDNGPIEVVGAGDGLLNGG